MKTIPDIPMSIKSVATWTIAFAALYSGITSYTASVFNSHQRAVFKYLEQQPGLTLSVESQSSDFYSRRQVLKLSFDDQQPPLYIRHSRSVWPFLVLSDFTLRASVAADAPSLGEPLSLSTAVLTDNASLSRGDQSVEIDLDQLPATLDPVAVRQWLDQRP